MDAVKKNLIYKALAVTFAIMFFSLFFSQVIYERKINTLDSDITFLQNEIEEYRIFVNLSDELFHRRDKRMIMESFMKGISWRIFETGMHIEKMSENREHVEEFNRIKKEWVFLNIELWIKLLNYNKISANNKNYILYFYPPKCEECVSYRNVLNLSLIHI